MVKCQYKDIWEDTRKLCFFTCQDLILQLYLSRENNCILLKQLDHHESSTITKISIILSMVPHGLADTGPGDLPGVIRKSFIKSLASFT